jgi:hypothetical protein
MLRSILAALAATTRYIIAAPLVVGELVIAPFRWLAMSALPAPTPALEAVGASAAMAVSNDAIMDAEAAQRRREREARRTQAYGMPIAHASVAAGPVAQAAAEQVVRKPRTREPAQPPEAVLRAQAKQAEMQAQEIEARRSPKAAALREAQANLGIEVGDEVAERIIDKYGPGPRPGPGM